MRASTVPSISGVEVGITVGIAAFTKKVTVALILMVGAGVVVGAGVGVGTLVGAGATVGTGAGDCVAQPSPMIPEVSSINAKGRSRMYLMGDFIAPSYQSWVITLSYDRAIPEVPLDHKEYWWSGDQSLQRWG